MVCFVIIYKYSERPIFSAGIEYQLISNTPLKPSALRAMKDHLQILKASSRFLA